MTHKDDDYNYEILQTKPAATHPAPRLPISAGLLKKILSHHGRATILVRGESMVPFIRPLKDKVTIQRIDDGELLYKGDIVLSRTDLGTTVIHRIVSPTVIENDQVKITLMGDANLWKTEQCKRGDIIARVDRIIRGNGKPVDCRSHRFKMLSTIWYNIRWLLQPMK